MYWTAWTFLLLLLGIDVIDWRRVRDLLPAAMAGVIISGIQIGMPQSMLGMTIHDTGPVTTNTAVTLLIQSLGGPVFAMWFVQGTTPNRLPLPRIALFTAISLCVMWMAHAAGRLTYAPWWNTGWSVLYLTAWYFSLWKVYGYCLKGRARAGHAAEEPHGRARAGHAAEEPHP